MVLFPNCLVMLNIIYTFISHLFIFFIEISVHVFYHLSYWIVLEFGGFFMYSIHKSLVEREVYKYFLPVCSLSLHHLCRDSQSKVSNFDEVQFIIFSSYTLCLWYQVYKLLSFCLQPQR